MTTIAIADDHKLFCESLAGLINDFKDLEVIWTAFDGLEATEKLKAGPRPNILLLDINMPRKNGIEVAEWTRANYPEIKILALTMEDDDNSVMQMIKNGAKGYLLKTITGDELKHALECLIKYGFYYTPLVTDQIDKRISAKIKTKVPEPTAREKQLLELLCTDLSYAEIAEKMFLSESTIDTYRARLFEKFEVNNRVGLLLKAHHLGLVKL